ncbi:MAG: hypothetical protein ABUL72_02245, partial [Armatimonadota bacterium]
MSKLLLVALSPDEIVQSAGFAEQIGLPWDVFLVTGTAESGPSSGTVWCAGLESVPTANTLVEVICDFIGARAYTHIVAVSSMAAKDLLARVAGRMDIAMVTDAVSVEAPNRFVR